VPHDGSKSRIENSLPHDVTVIARNELPSMPARQVRDDRGRIREMDVYDVSAALPDTTNHARTHRCSSERESRSHAVHLDVTHAIHRIVSILARDENLDVSVPPKLVTQNLEV
jgi:hypothetical protein